MNGEYPVTLEPGLIAALRTRFRGALLRPGEEGYEETRRGGGHAVAGHGVCDGGLMIDLSLMKATRLDPGARTVRAAGGLLWSEFDRATQRFGLATQASEVHFAGAQPLDLDMSRNVDFSMS